MAKILLGSIVFSLILVAYKWIKDGRKKPFVDSYIEAMRGDGLWL